MWAWALLCLRTASPFSHSKNNAAGLSGTSKLLKYKENYKFSPLSTRILLLSFSLSQSSNRWSLWRQQHQQRNVATSTEIGANRKSFLLVSRFSIWDYLIVIVSFDFWKFWFCWSGLILPDSPSFAIWLSYWLVFKLKITQYSHCGDLTYTTTWLMILIPIWKKKIDFRFWWALRRHHHQNVKRRGCERAREPHKWRRR